MLTTPQRLEEFVQYVRTHLEGDEKGEAQVFLERLIVAYGNPGHKEVGAKLEHRVKQTGQHTRFVDLLWNDRCLIEMKKRGEKLERHRQQATEYWLRLIPHPKYVVLCNFDEFWIYDFNVQVEAPVDIVKLDELPSRYKMLDFLRADWKPAEKILFLNNLVDVTRTAAKHVAQVYNKLVDRGIDKGEAQLFVLQCVFALFAEDIGLLEEEFFSRLLLECLDGHSTYDLVGGLFRQMNAEKRAPAGRFKNVAYFDGGLFAREAPIELETEEIELLLKASTERWNRVQPAIFGTIFEQSLGKGERHALGAHYTHEVDILKVVLPTIVDPWQEKISKASTLRELLALKDELSSFRVLDPACGSGNFLYVAYRALKRLEAELNLRINTEYTGRAAQLRGRLSQISTKQFFGIDINSFAVDLAKVTLVIAKKLAIDESHEVLANQQLLMQIQWDTALPLDNLDGNIVCKDAVFEDWPTVDAIVGNPPFQGKKNLRKEFGRDYVERLRAKYPPTVVSGRADYCVYWFRRAHEFLPDGGRAGLIGTNHIRRTYSRKSGLDYIVATGGTITEAVATQVWSGDSDVHVSIVNWVKGKQPGKKKIWSQVGDKLDSPFRLDEVDIITGSLSADFDTGDALPLKTNKTAKIFYQGQTHGDDGFLLTPEEAEALKRDKTSRDVIHPYLIGLDLLRRKGSLPSRYVIDLNNCNDVVEAAKHKSAFEHLLKEVMPVMKKKAEEEKKETGKENGERQRHFKKWWHFWRSRRELIERIESLPRYLVFSRHMKRPIAEFVHNTIRPNDALQVFTVDDDYSFGILQSAVHAAWFKQRGGTLTARSRMTPEVGFVTFPWPQRATIQQIQAVAKAATSLRSMRRKLMNDNNWTFKNLYDTLDVPGTNNLVAAHDALDQAVRAAYGMTADDDPLEFLLELNADISALEDDNQLGVAPGLPPGLSAAQRKTLISEDCIRMA